MTPKKRLERGPIQRLRIEDGELLRTFGGRRELPDVLHEVIEEGVHALQGKWRTKIDDLERKRERIADFLKGREPELLKALQKEGIL